MVRYKTKRKEDIGVSFSNLCDLSSDSNLSLHSALSQIAQDAC